MTTKDLIKTFLSKNSKAINLDEEQDIFASGYVNSLFALQIVIFLEKQFNIVITDEDLEIKNFRTINAMINLVERKRGRAIESSKSTTQKTVLETEI